MNKDLERKVGRNGSVNAGKNGLTAMARSRGSISKGWDKIMIMGEG